MRWGLASFCFVAMVGAAHAAPVTYACKVQSTEGMSLEYADFDQIIVDETAGSVEFRKANSLGTSNPMVRRLESVSGSRFGLESDGTTVSAAQLRPSGVAAFSMHKDFSASVSVTTPIGIGAVTWICSE